MSVSKDTELAPNKPNTSDLSPEALQSKTGDIIKSNVMICGNTGLLALPTELRLEIWKFALGDQVVHLDGIWNSAGYHITTVLRSHLCRVERSPGQLREAFSSLKKGHNKDSPPNTASTTLADSGLPSSTDLWQDTLDHLKCHPSFDHEFSEKNNTATFVSTVRSLLLLCRIVSYEASRVLYTTTLFSFRSGWNSKDVQIFLGSRSIQQKHVLRRLNLCIHYTYHGSNAFYCHPQWAKTLSLENMKDITSLRSLHIYLKEIQNVSETSHAFTVSVEDCLKPLRALHLKIFTVVSSPLVLGYGKIESAVTHTQKLEFADSIERAVLGLENAALPIGP